MGKTIVEKEHKDPGKRSRLWHHKDIHHVLRSRMGEAIEGMHLDMSKINSIKLNPDTFLKMYKLRFLDFFPSSKVEQRYTPLFRFYCWRSLRKELLGFDNCTCSYCSPDKESENKVLAFEGLEFVSTELTFFRWFGCPLKSLRSNSNLGNLVALIMPRSNIEQLGDGIQRFDKLKHINLSHSKQLTRILDLSLCPDLESLILEGCSNLIEVPSSIQYLKKLVILNLRGCISLSTLPTSIQSESLTYVLLSGCSNLKMAPKISGSMESVYLDGTAIKELPIECPSSLYDLSIENCSRLESLPSTIGYGMPSSCRVRLDKITRLSLRGCEAGQVLVDSVFCLLTSSLTFLDLHECQFTKLPDSLCDLSGLQTLNLSGNNRLECIPANISSLTNLKSLDVSNCERLQVLPKLPKLVELQVHNCTLLEAPLELFFSRLHRSNEIFNFANCFKMYPNKLVTTVENTLLRRRSKFQNFALNVGVCCPGNEIPEYFSCQNMGSSITLKLPLDCMEKSQGNNIRCMMCIVVTPQHHHPIDRSFRVGFKYTAKSRDGKIRGQLLGLSNVWKLNHHFRRFYMASDHVLFWYSFNILEIGLPRMTSPIPSITRRSTAIPKMWIKNGKNFTSSGFSDSVTIDFYIDGCDNLQVKKCGVELLFDQDERKKQIEGSRGSDKKKQKMWEGQGEEEEQPQRKRLKSWKSFEGASSS